MRRLKHIASPSFLSSFLLFHSSGPSFLSFESYCSWTGCGDKCPWSHSTINFEVVSLSYVLKKIATLGWLLDGFILPNFGFSTLCFNHHDTLVKLCSGPTSASSIFFFFFFHWGFFKSYTNIPYQLSCNLKSFLVFIYYCLLLFYRYSNS